MGSVQGDADAAGEEVLHEAAFEDREAFEHSGQPASRAITRRHSLYDLALFIE
jgi:hypothetical protein